MAINDLTGLNISSTYKRLLTVGDDGLMYDGTGSLYTPLSASHEVTKELSSSYAETASFATNFIASGEISASGLAKAKWFDSQTVATGYRLGGSNILYFKDSYYTFGRQNANVLISGSTINLGKPGETNVHVTASGNISSSGEVIGLSGSFTSLTISKIDGGTF